MPRHLERRSIDVFIGKAEKAVADRCSVFTKINLFRKAFHMNNCDYVQVQARSNDGVDVYLPAESEEAATAIAKSVRVTTNHMVCIEVNGERTKRWDRDRIEGENNWRVTDPDEMETLGKIRIVRRSG